LVLPTDDFIKGVEYPKEDLEKLFELDFNEALQSANDLLEEIEVPETIKGVICEMCFQLGKPRVMKFKKMWEGLEAGDYNKAADEMIDSAWHKQTTSRCESLAELVRGCK
jgi:GH24 family phage-related lysozyme (muramidase)